jgi:hypothetical protein
MNTSMTHSIGRDPNGSTKIALPTWHPKWCEVDTHQGMLDDLEDDGLDPDPSRKHWAMAGSSHLHEVREGDDEVIRDGGDSWNLQLGRQPNGWPFISLHTSARGIRQVGGPLITCGEARVLAAQLVTADHRLDLP